MEDNRAIKQVIAIVASAFLLYVAYYGSYLPWQKSTAFIDALRGRSAGSVSDFENTFKTPLDIDSPIGQEELVRNLASTVLGITQNTKDPRITADLLNFINGYYDPILSSGRGMSFDQNLYIEGALYEVAFMQTKSPDYLKKAQQYFEEGLIRSPKRPQFLYGAFDIYRLEGNVDRVRQVGNQILSQWPDDQKTRTALADFLAKNSSTLPAKQ